MKNTSHLYSVETLNNTAMKPLTTKETKKLQKALEYARKAEQLINEVAKGSDTFRYGSNTNGLINRIDHVVSTLENGIKYNSY